jgi:stalled ribosome rescue protein Dom34
VSAARARVFHGTRHLIAENTAIDLPGGVQEVAAETNYENTLNMAPVARTRAGTPGGTPKTHNFGEDPEAQRKAQLIEYLHRVVARLEEFFSGRPEPVVLAARSEIHGHIRTLVKQMNLVEPVLELNPDAFPPDELHRRAWAVVEPLFQVSRTEALDRFNSLLGTGDGKAATKPEEIVKAARYGRVDTLFVAADDHLWGRFDEAADRVVAHGTAQAEDEDLLDYAAVQTYLQGGAVNVLPKQDLPGNGPIAAILRY